MSQRYPAKHAEALAVPEIAAVAYLVQFDCHEYAIRGGSGVEEVMYPDPLGCQVISVRLMEGVTLRGMPWLKDGEFRCEPVLGI